MNRTLGLILTVVLAAGFTVAAQAQTARSASADGNRSHRSADVTFTKWLTSFPNDPSAAGASMAGVVGGDVGEGSFVGKIIKDDTSSKPGFWLGQALYGFNGSRHAFVAYNFITEDDTASPVTATIVNCRCHRET